MEAHRSPGAPTVVLSDDTPALLQCAELVVNVILNCNSDITLGGLAVFVTRQTHHLTGKNLPITMILIQITQ